VYSNGAYPIWQRVTTSISNLSGLAGLDLMVVVAAGWLIAHVVTAFRRPAARKRASTLVRLGARVTALGAALALWFMASWGLNYRRTPLTEHLEYDRARVTATRVRDLAGTAVSALNAGHVAAHADPWPAGVALVARLAPAFSEGRGALGLPRDIVPGRPKVTLLGPYFRAAGIAGFTNPFLLEVMLTPDALPFERPALLAHEWAHLAGLTGEAEAGFLGWVTCMRGDAQARYSGWLDLFPRLLGGLPAGDRRRLMASLDAGVRADYRAIEIRLQRVRPLVRDVAWRGYDRYLRANRVADGVQNYDAIVHLVAGTAFDSEWRPRLRR
jgi:hypothetical protein